MKTRPGRGSKAGKRRRRALSLDDIENLPPTVTIPEFAEIFNCTRQHVWQQVKVGTIQTTAPLGKVIRISRPEVLRIYKGGTQAI